MMKILLTAILWIYLNAAGAIAETDNAAHTPSNVGRLLIDGRDVCNATLIAPSIILTAAHCLYAGGSSDSVRIEQAQFLIRSYSDKKRRVFDIRDIAVSPKFKQAPHHTGSIQSLKYDVALLRLNGIATRSTVEEIVPPDINNSITFITRHLSMDRTPIGAENCLTKMLRAEEVLLLSCTRNEGFSGTPVFARVDGHRKVVGVVTARSTRSNVPILYASIPVRMFDTLVWKRDVGNYFIESLMLTN